MEQSEHSECGLVSCAMIIAAFGRPVNMESLRTRYGVPRNGTSLANLNSILSDYGIRSRGVRIDDVHALRDMATPIILHWDKDHFVVFDRYLFGRYHVIDPAGGRNAYNEANFIQHYSGEALIPNPHDVVQASTKGLHMTARSYFYEFVKLKPGLMFLTLIFSLMIQSLGLAIPSGTRYIIDHPSWVASQRFFMITLLIIAGSFFIYYVINVFSGLVLTHMQVAFGSFLFRKYMTGALKHDYSFFVNRSSGDMIYRASLIMVIEQTLTSGFISSMVSLLFLVIYLITMLAYSIPLTVMTLCICLIILLVSMLFAAKNNQLVEGETIAQTEVQKSFIQIFTGIETIKSLNLERHFYGQWSHNLDTQLAFQKRRGRLSAWLSSLSTALIFILPISIVAFGMFMNARGIIGLGTVVGFMTLASSFVSPFSNITTVISQFVAIGTYVRKVTEILPVSALRNNNMNGIDMQDQATVNPRDIYSIHINNICFSYTVFDQPVLHDIDFRIQGGEKIAIVGPTGSGKSTLLKIIAGLITPTQGSVQVNDRYQIESTSRPWRAHNIAYLHQDSTVFNDSLEDNIILHRKDIPSNILHKVCEQVGIDTAMTGGDQTLSTMISEHGMNLSGGQRQKIAIARALVGQPSLLLMDEPTSSLDNDSERRIMDYLLHSSTTCVVVAHRLASIRQFNQIYVMEHGTITEQGTHEQLIKRQGLYSHLYRSPDNTNHD